MFYLIATCRVIEGTYKALVAYSDDSKEIHEKKSVEEMCWSDEGVEYEVIEGFIGESESAETFNCEYDFIMDRVSK
jgi:hypothetical protein